MSPKVKAQIVTMQYSFCYNAVLHDLVNGYKVDSTALFVGGR